MLLLSTITAGLIIGIALILIRNVGGVIDPWLNPGMSDPVLSAENEFTFGPADWQQHMQIVLVSTAIDTNNTPTTTLRRGLVIAKVAASGKYAEYDPTATDGREIAVGILNTARTMLSHQTGSVADRVGTMLVRGALKVGNLYGFDEQARRQLQDQFLFDDLRPVFGEPRLVVAKTADYTVLSTDNGKIFTNRGASGAVVFTLPTIARGLHFSFCVEADQNVTVTAGTADTLVAFNDAAADSIAFSTSSEKVGGWIEVYANDNASKWLVKVSLGAETQTPTIAT